MIRLTHEDGSLFLVNELQIENIVDTANGLMIQIIEKPNSCFVVKESLEQIEDMVLRDQFAMSAMNGFIASDYEGNMTNEELSSFSYKQADAMLKQRKEK